MKSPCLALILLTGAGGHHVHINPAAVTSLRDARAPDHTHQTARCLVFTRDGKFIGVAEDCATVAAKMK
jgi:hypothetical protein